MPPTSFKFFCHIRFTGPDSLPETGLEVNLKESESRILELQDGTFVFSQADISKIC